MELLLGTQLRDKLHDLFRCGATEVTALQTTGMEQQCIFVYYLHLVEWITSLGNTMASADFSRSALSAY